MQKDIFKRINKFVLFYILTFCFLGSAYAQEQIAPLTKIEQGKDLISFNLKDTDLKDALKIIAQSSGLNIILDKDVSAKVNITLKEVDWQTALDNILKTNELTYRIQGNIIRVMTLASVKKEEEIIPLATKIITLNFAKAEELKGSLTKVLSLRGSMEVNVRTNSLIISDTPEIIERVENIAQKLDTPTPQVLIEALVMSVKLTDTDKFGITWTATHKEEPSRRITQTLLAPSSTLDLYYGKTILPKWLFDAQLAIYAQDKRVKILANPRVLTLDNLAAQIEITEQVPYTYTSQSTEGASTITSTQFKEVGIKLYVTPHITKDKFVSMSVKAEQSYVAAYVGTTNEPAIDSRKAETNLMLKDGETVVIGGLRKRDNTVTIDKIPILGDIPFLGKFFRKEVKETVDTELLIFVTPHIMEKISISEEEKEKLEKSKDELYLEDRDKAIFEALTQKKKRKEQIRLEKEIKQQELARKQEEKERQRQLEAEQKEKQRLERLEQRRQEELTGREQRRQAKEEQARLERQRKELISSLYQEALTYYKNNQFDQAKETFNKILLQDPNQTKARSYLESKIPRRIKALELRQKEQTPETKQ